MHTVPVHIYMYMHACTHKARAFRGVKRSGIKEASQQWPRQLLSVIKSRRTSSIQQLAIVNKSINFKQNHQTTTASTIDRRRINIIISTTRTRTSSSSNQDEDFIEQQPGRGLHRAATRTRTSLSSNQD